MELFIQTALAMPTGIYSVMLGFLMVYWLFVIIGVADLDMLDLDGALDGGVDGVKEGIVDGALDGAKEGLPKVLQRLPMVLLMGSAMEPRKVWLKCTVVALLLGW